MLSNSGPINQDGCVDNAQKSQLVPFQLILIMDHLDDHPKGAKDEVSLGVHQPRTKQTLSFA